MHASLPQLLLTFDSKLEAILSFRFLDFFCVYSCPPIFWIKTKHAVNLATKSLAHCYSSQSAYWTIVIVLHHNAFPLRKCAHALHANWRSSLIHQPYFSRPTGVPHISASPISGPSHQHCWDWFVQSADVGMVAVTGTVVLLTACECHLLRDKKKSNLLTEKN